MTRHKTFRNLPTACLSRIGCLLVAATLLLPVPTPGKEAKPKSGITAARLRAILEEVRLKHKVPALGAGIVRGGKEPVVAVAGLRKRGETVRAEDGDAWHLGSNTKPMTALLIALLIDLGLLDWD